jgi:TonB family protein
MNTLLRAAIGIVIFTSFWNAVSAQDTDVLKSRVLSAIRRSTISGGGMQPYKLTAKVTIYDGAGKNPVDGEVEILRRATGLRISVVFPTARYVLLSTQAGSYSSGDRELPFYAVKIIRALQEPVQFAGFDTAPAAQSEPRGSLDCASLTDLSAARVIGPNVPRHEVCLDPPGDDIRIVFDGNDEFVRDEISLFEDHQVAYRVGLKLAGVAVAEARINSLESAHLEDADFVPSSDMKPVTAPPTHLTAEVMVGKIVKHVDPKYPGAARAAHIQGIVVLHAIIGKDGHIRDLSVISSPDPMLSEASIKAVKQWVYEPYTLKGEPTEIDTTISVNFAFGK